MRCQTAFKTNCQRVVSPDIFDSKELVDDKVVTVTKSVGMVEECFLQTSTVINTETKYKLQKENLTK